MVRLAIALLFVTQAFLFAQAQEGKRVDVPFWAKINLQQFGGPNVDIIICGKNMGVVEFAVIDNEHEVVTAASNNDPYSPGDSHVVFSPVTVRKSIHLEHGVEVSGTRAEAYLLHEIADGPKVYFLDALDTKQNECALLITTKPKQQNSVPIDERLRKIEKLREEGAITEAEARKKRQEILDNL